MKKFLSIILVLCIAFAFMGCVKPRPTTVVVQNSSDANDTYIKKYSNSKSPEIDNTDGTPVEIAAQ